MKRIMIAMLSLMLTLPIMAQYGRPRYSSGRYGYSTYTRTNYRHNPVNSYSDSVLEVLSQQSVPTISISMEARFVQA